MVIIAYLDFFVKGFGECLQIVYIWTSGMNRRLCEKMRRFTRQIIGRTFHYTREDVMKYRIAPPAIVIIVSKI